MADLEPSPPPIARRYLEFPHLLRAIGIATDGKKLILAALGLLALTAGWSALDRAFGGPALPLAMVEPGSLGEWFSGETRYVPLELGSRVAEPFRAVVMPFLTLFQRAEGPAIWFRTALMALWAVAVWGIFGGAIARIATVQAASNRRIGLGSAIRFSLAKSASFIGAPLIPLMAVAIFAGSCALIGSLYRIPWGIGSTVGSLLWFVPLGLGLVMTLILAGLAVGWPLMIATVAAEGEDAPDALSRSYSYVNQRLARYAAHAVAAWAIGAIGLAVAILFSRAVVALAGWGVALGAPDPLPSTPLADSVQLLWLKLVGLLVHGWVYSYFWSAVSIIYLILRRDVDGTDWHDVYLPEHSSDTFADELGSDTLKPTLQPAEAEVG